MRASCPRSGRGLCPLLAPPMLESPGVDVEPLISWDALRAFIRSRESPQTSCMRTCPRGRHRRAPAQCACLRSNGAKFAVSNLQNHLPFINLDSRHAHRHTQQCIDEMLGSDPSPPFATCNGRRQPQQKHPVSLLPLVPAPQRVKEKHVTCTSTPTMEILSRGQRDG